MSDLVIKNLELPKEGLDFIAIDPNGHVYYPIFKDMEKRDTEAIVLPDHGDLIDKDELIKYISDTFCKPCKRSKPTVCRACDFGDVMDIIEEETPVVLPKSGS